MNEFIETDTAAGAENIEEDPQDTNDQMEVEAEENISVDIGQSPIGAKNLSTLNVDCLLLILDYLDSESLMKLCEVNKYFNDVVSLYKHVLNSKLFNIQEHQLIRPIYTNFGKFIRKLDLTIMSEGTERSRDVKNRFNDMLELMIEHFDPNTLIDLTLRLEHISINKDLLQRALPFMRKLEKFALYHIQSGEYSRSLDHILNEIIGNAKNLKSLELRSVCTTGDFFRHKHLRNLRHLSFYFSSMTKYRAFQEFFERKPLLKSLIWCCFSVHNQRICNMVSKFIPHIKMLQLRNPNYVLPYEDNFDYSDRKIVIKDEESEPEEEFDEEEFEENEFVDSGEDTDDEFGSDYESDLDGYTTDTDLEEMQFPEFNTNLDLTENWQRAHQSLNKLNKLETLWLKSIVKNGSDLSDTLIMLAKQNTVKELTMQFELICNHGMPMGNQNKPETVSFPNFQSLKSLRLVSPAPETMDFLQNFIASAHNLNKCVLDYEYMDSNVESTILQIVELTTKLEIFVLKMPPRILNSTLYRKIARIRRNQQRKVVHGDKKPLLLYICSQNLKNKCVKRLGSSYDENSVEIRVKSFMEWETDAI